MGERAAAAHARSGGGAVRGSGVPALGLALALDATLGEPPARLHPVALMGRGVGRLVAPDPPGAGLRHRLRGSAVVLGGIVASVVAAETARQAAGSAVRRALDRFPAAPATGAGALRRGAAVAAEATTLWPLLAVRALTRAARRVAAALDAGDDGTARVELRWLVGRPLEGLPAPLLASAAVESLAENLADSVVAPLFWARLGGPGAAAAYRFVNTADAMVGYRDRHRRGGWAAARTDDLLGLVPARLSAALIVAAAPAGGGSGAGALRCWMRDGGRTASPNAGRPMAAMAGALGVRLEKRGHHVLGGGRAPGAADIHRAARIVETAALLTPAVLAAIPLRACHAA